MVWPGGPQSLPRLHLQARPGSWPAVEYRGAPGSCEALEVPTVEAGEEQMRFLLPFSTFPPNWKIYLCECGLLAGLT